MLTKQNTESIIIEYKRYSLKLRFAREVYTRVYMRETDNLSKRGTEVV